MIGGSYSSKEYKAAEKLCDTIGARGFSIDVFVLAMQEVAGETMPDLVNICLLYIENMAIRAKSIDYSSVTDLDSLDALNTILLVGQVLTEAREAGRL